MLITPINTSALDAGASTTATNANSGTDPNAAQDRFLKLLVAQLTNQDPMNPMDNAEMTSQMAQINTVTGIQQLNLTMQSMAEQFAAMQTLQGTQMIGRTVLVDGNKMSLDEEGTATGNFSLGNTSTSTKVEVMSPGGLVVATVELGAMEKGSQSFTWDASQYSGEKSDLTFRVTAMNKENVVSAVPVMQAKVTGTGTESGALTLTLDSGSTVKYSSVRAVL